MKNEQCTECGAANVRLFQQRKVLNSPPTCEPCLAAQGVKLKWCDEIRHLTPEQPEDEEGDE